MPTQPPAGDPRGDATRERLIDAAGRVFAQQGYDRATVRDICRIARANIAAVNYHFGGKERLYAEALGHWGRRASEQFPVRPGPDGASPDQRLRGFVRSFMDRLADRGRPTWHIRLMMREMAEPTPAFDHVVEQYMKPVAAMLRQVVLELLPSGADRAAVHRCMLTVMGQIMVYHHAHAVITRLMPGGELDKQDLDQLADHIATVSLAGFAAVRRRPPLMKAPSGPAHHASAPAGKSSAQSRRRKEARS